MRIILYIFLILVILVGTTFAILNPTTVTIDYWIAKKTLALPLLVVWVFIVGLVVGLLLSGLSLFQARLKNRKLSSRLKLLEQEVQNLRAIPLRDKH